jgi:hypothetical protein
MEENPQMNTFIVKIKLILIYREHAAKTRLKG